MKKIKEMIAFVLSLAIVTGVCYYLPYKLMPPKYDYGALWNMYGEEPKDSIDVLFIGSSLTYCDIIPAAIYEKTEVTSYVLAGSTLNSALGYYYLKQGLKTQSPDLVMIEATSAFFKKQESFSKANIGYMPYGINRLGATLVTAESSERFGLLFPLYNYHELWQENSFDSIISPRPDRKPDINAGYTYITDIVPQPKRVPRGVAEKEDIEFNLGYLKKTVELCRKEGIEVELFLSPCCYYIADKYKDMLSEALPDVSFIDYSDYSEDMGLDMATDYCGKIHLNFYGADKFSDYLADRITDNFEITHRQHPSELWQQRVENYKKCGG